MSVKINLGPWSSIFAVPTKIVDEKLKFLDHEQLRVLLYLLRNSDKELTDKMISSATGVNEKAIPDILDFWVSFGVLSKDNGSYDVACEQENNLERESISLLSEQTKYNSEEINAMDEVKTKPEPHPEKQSKQHFALSRPKRPDYVFTAQRLAVDEELRILVNEAQEAFGKVLSNSDVSTLLMLKDTCGLPLAVILMLIQYCISIDKGNIRTVEKIGTQWADEGIYSIEAAENKIMQVHRTSKNFSIVSSAFGLRNIGSPTQKQLEYGDRWVGEWNFSPEMLREAYERCVDSKGQLNFRYIDGILKRWHTEGIQNKNDLAASEKLTAKPAASKKPNSSIDYSKLDKLSIPDV